MRTLLIVVAVAIVLVALAWWTSGPRFQNRNIGRRTKNKELSNAERQHLAKLPETFGPGPGGQTGFP